MNYILNFLKSLLLGIGTILWWELRKLSFVSKDVKWSEITEDFSQIFKSTYPYLIFNFLAFLVFFMLPQGRDVLLIVIENLKSAHPGSLLSLLFGLTIWCIISEFGVRYRIYVTDNSGKALTSERVAYRKQLQKFIYLVYLLLPIIIVFVSILIVWINNFQSWKWSDTWPYMLVLVLMLLLFSILLFFYTDEDFILMYPIISKKKSQESTEQERKKFKTVKEKEEEQSKTDAKNRRTLLSWRLFRLEGDEANWVSKLYGIYNDFSYQIRYEGYYKQNPYGTDNGLGENYKAFINSIKSLPHHEDNIPELYYREVPETDENGDEIKIDGHKVMKLERVGFPDEYLANVDDIVPLAFGGPTYKDFDYKVLYDDKTKTFKKEKNIQSGAYRWVYINNPDLFKKLHKIIKWIFAVSLILIIITSFFGVPFTASFIGTPGLVCIAFASWLGVLTGLLYIDKYTIKKFPISLRLLIVIWFFIVSAINNDHPVRENCTSTSGDYKQRPSLDEHFSNWFAMRKKNNQLDSFWLYNSTSDSIAYHYFRDNNQNLLNVADTTPGNNSVDSSSRDSLKAYPVIFITAEGGALRTGAFTSLLLSRLLYRYPTLKNHIYAFSTVSGGTVGVGLFNALTYLQPKDEQPKDSLTYAKNIKTFFLTDQLSPVMAKMFYGDALNYFIPYQIPAFDRAIALEKAWEYSYFRIFNKSGEENVFSTNYMSLYNQQPLSPAWFINTTEVETGLQCYISNVKADSFLFSKDRDLLRSRISSGIAYSTAIGFSTRFPLISPSAAIKQDDNVTYHYVDGGYAENTGAKTMLEILHDLHDSLHRYNVQPIVIQLRFGEDQPIANTGFLNEINSIGSGIYNIRSGYSKTYSKQLEIYTKDTLKGCFASVALSASSKEVPLNWVLSENSWKNLDSAVNKTLSENQDLKNCLQHIKHFK